MTENPAPSEQLAQNMARAMSPLVEQFRLIGEILTKAMRDVWTSPDGQYLRRVVNAGITSASARVWPRQIGLSTVRPSASTATQWLGLDVVPGYLA